MANTFYREPITGADENQWAPYLLGQIREAIGHYTARLYNDAGTLKITEGRIGIDNETNQGVSDIDTVTTISLAGVTNGNWAKIEMTVAGSSVTFAAADTNTGTDTNLYLMPSAFTGAYDNEKNGYYIAATKRCIGVVYKDAGGSLQIVVNALDNKEGYLSDEIDLGRGDISKLMYKSEDGINMNRAVFRDADVTYDQIYDFLLVACPNLNDVRGVNIIVGEVYAANEAYNCFSIAKKTGANEITLYGSTINETPEVTGGISRPITDGAATLVAGATVTSNDVDMEFG